MNVTDLCNERREALLTRWAECFFSGYPLESVGFLRTGSDTFTNPVGQMTRESLRTLFDAVAGNDADPEAVKNALDSLMHLRAVQDMAPSHAVGPLYLIKSVMRKELLPLCLSSEDGASPNKGGSPKKGSDRTSCAALDEYFALESRVDSLALMALDLFAGAREKVFNLRVEEVKRNQSQILRLVKLRETTDEAGTRNRQSEGYEE